MMLSNVIVDVTIPRCSFVFGQSRAKVSAGFTNVRSMAVAAFDLVYCSLSVLPGDSATCITYSTDYHQRLTLESWFTNLEQMPVNRSRTNDLLTR